MTDLNTSQDVPGNSDSRGTVVIKSPDKPGPQGRIHVLYIGYGDIRFEARYFASSGKIHSVAAIQSKPGDS